VRFSQVIENELNGVVRSKGYFWLASRPRHAGSWSQAGGVSRQGLAGMWWASVPKERWPQDEENLQYILDNWVDGSGDARQELVFIGIDMDEAVLRDKLENALLTDDEMVSGPDRWVELPDPFQPWFN